MTSGYIPNTSHASEDQPVFQGLREFLFSGKDIASLVGVSPPTVSKWRQGRARVPAAKLAFLTLLLAHWLDEMGGLAARWAGTSSHLEKTIDSQMAGGLRFLRMQEAVNANLPPDAILEGARMFRAWLDANGRGRGLPPNLGRTP